MFNHLLEATRTSLKAILAPLKLSSESDVKTPRTPNWGTDGRLLVTGDLKLVSHSLTVMNAIVKVKASAVDEIGAVWDVSYTSLIFEMRCLQYPESLEGVYYFKLPKDQSRHIFTKVSVLGKSAKDALATVAKKAPNLNLVGAELLSVRRPKPQDPTFVPYYE